MAYAKYMPEFEGKELQWWGQVIRKDLLDKAGLDIPETVDEWENALKAFKDMGIEVPYSMLNTTGMDQALLAAYGKDRTYRTCFTKEELKGFACEAQILEDRWTIRFRIGIDILEKIYGPLHLQAGSTFTCNFYKISEAKEIEHYASYSPIKTTIPSFHLPEFFAMAEIVKRQGRKRKNK